MSFGRTGHFRPDVEGLRAVAVAAVVLYHAGVPFFNGGFIGVDVFFVISGFLITGLLVRELKATDRIALGAFYARRARRLLPMALLVIVVTLAVSALALSVIQFRAVAGDAAAAAVYVSNYRFALAATDYLASQEMPSPLLHFWSLGVEEQFYLVWPILILVSVRLLGLSRLWWVVASVGLLSLALSIWLTDTAQPWAFFSLPTRAWELALGALAAIGLIALPRRWPLRVASSVGMMGLAMIGASAILVGSDVPFPGWHALVPAVGAVLVIASGVRSETLVAQLLAARVARWVGRISYSLYLWHWPVLLLAPAIVGHDDLGFRLGLIAVCVALAEVTTRYVESPWRTGRLSAHAAPRVVGVAFALSIGVSLVSLVSGELAVGRFQQPPAAQAPVPGSSPTAFAPSVPPGSRALDPPSSLMTADLPDPPSLALPVLDGPLPAGLTPPLIDAGRDLARSVADGCQLPYEEEVPRECVYGDLASGKTVAIIGDSHAAQWLSAVEVLAEQRAWRILVFTKASCPAADVVVWLHAFDRPFRECDAWRETVLRRMETERPDLVFVSFSRAYDMAIGSGQVDVATDHAAWRAAVVRALDRVVSASSRTILIGTVPRHTTNPVHCLASNLVVEACQVLRAQVVDPAYAALEEEAARLSGAQYISPTMWLCNDGTCPLVFGRQLVYLDTNHLTATFARTLAPLLAWELDHPLGQ